MARPDLFIYLSTRVERLSRGKPHMYTLRTYFYKGRGEIMRETVPTKCKRTVHKATGMTKDVDY